MQAISPRQMQKGFVDVCNALDDLKIDVPEAPGLAATFIAAAWWTTSCRPPSSPSCLQVRLACAVVGFRACT